MNTSIDFPLNHLPPSHRNNELIKALGPPKTDEEVVAIFERPIAYDPQERLLPSEVRFQYIGCLRNFSKFLKRHRPLFRAFDGALREGYVGRDIGGIHHVQSLEALHALRTDARPVAGVARHMSNLAQLSLALTGVAGLGKTSALKCINDSYPPYIFHPRTREFQIPFLLFEIPAKGYSVQAMGDNVLLEIDRRIPGSNFFETYGPKLKISEDRIPGVMGVPLTICNAGFMCWEEAQRMAKVPRNKQDLSNVITFTGNTLKTPVGLSGTDGADAIINRSLSSTRRMQGLDKWRPLEEDEHYEFLKDLWRCDYTRKTPAMTAERLKILRACSAGVIGIDILLFQSCQREAIVYNDEIIDDKLITQVMRTQFTAFLPYVRALHMKQYDLLNGLCEELEKFRKRFGNATVEDLLNSATNVHIPATDAAYAEKVTGVLTALGYSAEYSSATAMQVQQDNPESTSGEGAILAMQLALGVRQRRPRGSAKLYALPPIEISPADYRHAIVRAQQRKSTTADELLQMGAVADLSNGFPMAA